MGRRGPPKTPTETLKIRGSWRAKEREKTEPKAEKGRPRCPDWLSARAKQVWRHLIPMLDRMGVLRRIDRYALERYCTTYDRWRAALDWISERGESHVTYDSAGKATGMKRWPQSRIATEMGEQLGRLELKFGLTPSDRASLNADTNTTQGDALDDFLDKQKKSG